MKKIFSAALALVCVWFATPSFANCNLTQRIINKTYTVSVNDGHAVISDITYKENTPYTITIDVEPSNITFSEDGNLLWWVIKYTDGSFSYTGVTSSNYNDGRVSVTTSSNKTVESIAGLTSHPRWTGGTLKVSNLQIEEGTTATPYQPYNATCIDPCANMFNMDWLLNASGWTKNGGVYTGSCGSQHWYAKDGYPITFAPNTQYIITGHIDNNPGFGRFEVVYTDDTTGAIGFDTRVENTDFFVKTYPGKNVKSLRFNYADSGVMEVSNIQVKPAYCSEITIATTKYNETKFSPLNTALANAISVVDSVVSNTITQAASIATLQAQKQTRPADDPSDANNAENCPAGKKCLLVEDASGIPHWYEIVENAWDLPVGYTQLEYIESTGTQFIDTGYVWASQNRKVDMDVMVTTYTSNSHFFASTRGSEYDLNPYFANANSSFTTYIGGTPYIPATFAKDEKNNIVWNLTSDKKFSLQINDRSVDTKPVTAIPTSGVSVYLLHVHSAGNNSWNPLRAKLYQTKMWDNDELVRDFVPAKNPDGKIGMYDLVGGRFYENAGDGEFIAGPVAE